MMRLDIVPSTQFKEDLKLAQKRGLKLDKLRTVVNASAERKTLMRNTEITAQLVIIGILENAILNPTDC